MKTSDRQILKGYYWNHDAIRKDVKRLESIIERLPNLSTGGFEKIKPWFDFHKFALEEHHTAEDTFFFPKIAERTTDFKAELARFDEEHKALDEHMATLERLFDGATNKEKDAEKQNVLKEAINQYCRLVIDHLDKEEAVVEKAMNEHFEKEEVLAAEEEFRNSMPKSKMAKLMPWMVDAMDEKDRQFFFSQLPFVPRLLYKFSLRKKYERMLPV